MTKDLQGSSHNLKVVGGAYGKRKDFIYEKKLEYTILKIMYANSYL